jgi:methionyl-tRNA synthetase
MSKYYISTAIAYVNAPPHIGHALEFIQADALSRYHRLIGDDTFFLTGTDEHGVKIYETAKGKGIEPQALVDENAEHFEALGETLDLSNDDFIRTSSARHKEGAIKIWNKMFEKGDIYKGVYSGLYCVGCEAYVAEKDLDDNGHCPNHKKAPKVLEEENYFFKLSAYSDQIKKAIESDELQILPKSRKNEMLNIIGDDGLPDISFSRPKEDLPWGITVPHDDSQVMYVWCDALSNYITAMGYAQEDERFETYWPADVHLIGKDILRFHAGIWIGMLISAEVSLPKSVYVHGFITSEGQKMGKSLGNVVDPLEYVDKYGTDSLRYYLLREIPSDDDGDFGHQRFVNVYNSELANSLGNLVNRVTMMVEKYSDGKVPAKTDGAEVLPSIEKVLVDYHEGFLNFNMKQSCEAIVELVNVANKYIDDKKPWAMAKEGDSELDDVLYNLLELLRFITVMLLPVLPSSAEKIAEQIGLRGEDLSLEANFGVLELGVSIKSGDSLFPRIEE